jgi:hypothetical protein
VTSYFALFQPEKAVFAQKADQELGEICLEIEKRYEVRFLRIGIDKSRFYRGRGFYIITPFR